VVQHLCILADVLTQAVYMAIPGMPTTPQDGKCPLYNIVKCPSRFFVPKDEEVLADRPLIEFEHGLHCAVSKVRACVAVHRCVWYSV
jgi:hypothetical protein